MTDSATRTGTAGPPDDIPEDIHLDEAGRNWVTRQSAADPARPLRNLAADAAVTAAIGQAYGAD
ncbi:MAG TPA: hypothetical protein VNH82_00520 [Candidatus Dormibacteraeota bacterium]|nr:hypothetical protein [Candidatus Dormibacteraeota bacterium]